MITKFKIEGEIRNPLEGVPAALAEQLASTAGRVISVLQAENGGKGYWECTDDVVTGIKAASGGGETGIVGYRGRMSFVHRRTGDH